MSLLKSRNLVISSCLYRCSLHPHRATLLCMHRVYMPTQSSSRWAPYRCHVESLVKTKDKRTFNLITVLIIAKFHTQFELKNIMNEILTVNNGQIDIKLWNFISWFDLSARVTASILDCDLVYNQRTVCCNTQPGWLRSNIFVNLPMSGQLYCCCVCQTTEGPGSTVTVILTMCHIFTRQSEVITNYDDKDGVK